MAGTGASFEKFRTTCQVICRYLSTTLTKIIGDENIVNTVKVLLHTLVNSCNVDLRSFGDVPTNVPRAVKHQSRFESPSRTKHSFGNGLHLHEDASSHIRIEHAKEQSNKHKSMLP